MSPQLPRKAQGCCSWSLPASLPFRHFLQPFYYFLLFYHDIYSICILDLPGRVFIYSSSVVSYRSIYIDIYLYIDRCKTMLVALCLPWLQMVPREIKLLPFLFFNHHLNLSTDTLLLKCILSAECENLPYCLNSNENIWG